MAKAKETLVNCLAFHTDWYSWQWRLQVQADINNNPKIRLGNTHRSYELSPPNADVLLGRCFCLDPLVFLSPGCGME